MLVNDADRISFRVFAALAHLVGGREGILFVGRNASVLSLMRSVLFRRASSGYAGTFLQRVNGVHGEVFEALEVAAGPADFHGICFCGGASGGGDAPVVVGGVAGAPADFVDEEGSAAFL